MKRHFAVLFVWLAANAGWTLAEESNTTWKALACPVRVGSTEVWTRLDYDGASRRVKPYLSSLGSGEQAVGVISSPTFAIATDDIVLTVRGHDGQGGGRGKNYVALVDAENGNVLKRAAAPGQDALKTVTWDVTSLQGRRVRIEVHDGLDDSAFAWLGIGTIDAGEPFSVDFKTQGLQGWKQVEKKKAVRQQDAPALIRGGVPFSAIRGAYSIVPSSGAVTVPCGFVAKRLFFLGCTVPSGIPGADVGTIRLVYTDGSTDAIELVYGFTLEGTLKRLSPSKAVWLHPSGDVFQYYLVVGPRPKPIREIVIEKAEEAKFSPRFTAITCETDAAGANLTPLPEAKLDTAERNWIRSHTLRSGSPDVDAIRATLRKDHKLP